MPKDVQTRADREAIHPKRDRVRMPRVPPKSEFARPHRRVRSEGNATTRLLRRLAKEACTRASAAAGFSIQQALERFRNCGKRPAPRCETSNHQVARVEHCLATDKNPLSAQSATHSPVASAPSRPTVR